MKYFPSYQALPLCSSCIFLLLYSLVEPHCLARKTYNEISTLANSESQLAVMEGSSKGVSITYPCKRWDTRKWPQTVPGEV